MEDILNTYKYDEYVCDVKDVKEMLSKKGVAIIDNVLTEEECKKMLSGAWDYLEHITSEWKIPLNRDDKKSWREFSDLFALHSMLIQHHSIGHSQWLWDLRQNKNVIDVFKHLWDTDDLLVSFDGASINFPPEETNKGWYHNKSWLHTDQSYCNSKFSCVQSWITAVDVNEGDSTLCFLQNSHNYHKVIADKFKITDKANWYKLNEEQIKTYKELGCNLYRIKCKKGTLVMWDSRIIHCGQEPIKGRKEPNIRCVGYVCFLPRSLITNTQLKKKRKAFEELRTTTHHPINVKLFAKSPRTYGKETQPIKKIDKPILTEVGMKLAGLI